METVHGSVDEKVEEIDSLRVRAEMRRRPRNAWEDEEIAGRVGRDTGETQFFDFGLAQKLTKVGHTRRNDTKERKKNYGICFRVGLSLDQKLYLRSRGDPSGLSFLLGGRALEGRESRLHQKDFQ